MHFLGLAMIAVNVKLHGRGGSQVFNAGRWEVWCPFGKTGIKRGKEGRGMGTVRFTSNLAKKKGFLRADWEQGLWEFENQGIQAQDGF